MKNAEKKTPVSNFLLQVETNKNGSVLSLVYIRSGLIFIEKCQIFQCKTKCKQKIKLSRASELQNLKKQWSQKKLFENSLIKIEFFTFIQNQNG